MKFIGKLLIAVVVIGGACMWAMYNGHWAGIIGFTQAVFGDETAENVDKFGNASKDVGDDVVEYGTGVYDQVKAGGKVTPDWGVLDDALGGFGKPGTERHPDYERVKFGDGWLDTDSNGCDTRNDILARDLAKPVIDSDKCTVLSGTLADLYTGKSIPFTRGAATSSLVQIDHIVPLALAWEEGAWKWSDEKRKAFANDPVNLRAVDGPTNSGKGAKSIGEWLPPAAGAHCTYVALYVAVHDKYELTMAERDQVAARKLIAACD